MNVVFAVMTAAILLANCTISALFVMWGWSLFFVSYFGMKMITFTQALGLMIISSSIFSCGNASTSKKG